jgi:tetratricopeptide (TPR) repeat protein
VLDCASRAEAAWAKAANAGAHEKAAIVIDRGHAYKAKGQFTLAISAYQEALSIYRAVSPESAAVCRALNWLAPAQYEAGDPDSAERTFNESLNVSKKINYEEGTAIAIGNLARMSLIRKDWPEAEQRARQALTLSQDLRRQQLIASNSLRLAEALRRQSKFHEGLPFAKAAAEIYERLGMLRHLQDAQAECTAYEAQ